MHLVAQIQGQFVHMCCAAGQEHVWEVLRPSLIAVLTQVDLCVQLVHVPMILQASD